MNTIGHFSREATLLIQRGGTVGPHAVQLKNPDGSAVDLTGSAIRGFVERAPRATKRTALACSITDAENGTFEFGIAAETSAALPGGKSDVDREARYCWHLEMIDSSGRVLPLVSGLCLVIETNTTTAS